MNYNPFSPPCAVCWCSPLQAIDNISADIKRMRDLTLHSVWVETGKSKVGRHVMGIPFQTKWNNAFCIIRILHRRLLSEWAWQHLRSWINMKSVAHFKTRDFVGNWHNCFVLSANKAQGTRQLLMSGVFATYAMCSLATALVGNY